MTRTTDRARNALFAAVALVALVNSGPPAGAGTAETHSTRMYGAMPREGQTQLLGELVRRADLIFHGRVESVDYDLSDRKSDAEVRLPHTFVTYEMADVLKGRSTRERITLRFMGGPTEQPGQHLFVETVPFFNVGQEDFLFVTAGQGFCPLVGCGAGHFRVIDERVYTSEGREVLLTPEGELAFGGASALEEATTQALAPSSPDLQKRLRAVREKLVEELPDEIRELGREALRAPPDRPVLRREGIGAAPDSAAEEGEAVREPVSATKFAGLIAEVVKRQQAAGVGKPRPVASAEIDEPFFVRMPQPAEAPRLEDDETDAERLERELLQKNQGNPVLKQQQ